MVGVGGEEEEEEGRRKKEKEEKEEEEGKKVPSPCRSCTIFYTHFIFWLPI